MILYFADRQFNILGSASTQLPKGLNITSDTKTESIDTGLKIFECVIEFEPEDRKKAERYTEPANYLLRSDGDENEFYTIIDTTINASGHSITLYCEDAGLDMINDVCGAYAASSAMTIAQYIDIFAKDSGFVVGHNEISNLTRKLSWDGEDTAATRIRSVATQFDNAEISFSFDIKNLEITKKYINIYKKRGEDAGVKLHLNREINNIETTKSVSNLATALYVTGGTPSGKSSPITLAGYAYDDGDFYSPKDSKYLYIRSALAKWSRMNWEGGSGTGHLVKQYSYETTSQSTLCSHAVTNLKELADVAINYEVDINNADDKQIGLGDTISIIDDQGELYLSARVLQIESSVTSGSKVLTLGDYLIKQSGISDRITALAGQFSNITTAIEGSITNVLHIESSNGLIFKDGIETTQLNVTIYRGSEVISNYEQLTAQLGYTAYLRWSYLTDTGYVEIPSSDSRLSNDSFTLTLSTADVAEKTTFKCELMLEGSVDSGSGV